MKEPDLEDELVAAVAGLEATHPADVVSCDRAEELLAARLGGKLRAGEQLGLEAHVASCAACAAVARELGDPTVADTLLDLGGIGAPDLTGLSVVSPEAYVRGNEVGRGGMGRVVRARDRRLGRSVVLKELLDERLRDRFEREARLTARLQHPAIISVLEAGQWPDGAPFYAMKHVAGEPLSTLLSAASTLAERLAYLPALITAVEAVAYAHAEGVVHRDLKPANIVVGPFGETVVIDWGLAKDLSDSQPDGGAGPYRDEDISLTRSGAGTPHYMPPEQAAGESPTPRVDVYALGATLYTLLAGRPPDAPLPADAPPELRTIVTRAMAGDPAQRYADARELADELRRFQNGLHLRSHQYSAREILARWIRRHRFPVAVLALALVSVAGLGTVAVRRVMVERARATASAVESRQRLGELAVERGRALLLAGENERALQAFDEAVQAGAEGTPLALMLTQAFERSSPNDSGPFGTGVDDVAAAVRLPDGAVALLSAAGRLRLHDGTLVVELGRPLNAVAASADGGFLAAACLTPVTTDNPSACSGPVALVERKTSRAVSIPTEGRLREIHFRPGSDQLATVGGTLSLWRSDGTLARRLPAPDRSAETAAFSPDGALVAIGDRSGVVQVVEIESGRELLRFMAHKDGVTALDLDESGWIVSGGWDTTARLWAPDGKLARELYRGRGRFVRQLLRVPGRIAVRVEWHDRVVLTDEEGAPVSGLDHDGPVIGMAADLDAAQIVTLTSRRLYVWTLDGVLVRRVPVGDLAPATLAFAADRRAYLLLKNQALRSSFTAELRPGVALPAAHTTRMVFDDRGNLALAQRDGSVQIWAPHLGLDARRGAPEGLVAWLPAARAEIVDALIPWGQGEFLVGYPLRAEKPGDPEVFRAIADTRGESWREAVDIPPFGMPSGVLASGLVVTSSIRRRDEAPVIAFADGTRVALPKGWLGPTALDPRGRLVYGWVFDRRAGGGITVIEARTGNRVAVLPNPPAQSIALASERPRYLFLTADETTIYDSLTGAHHAVLPFGGQVAVASPDGERVAILAPGSGVRVVDVQTLTVTFIDAEEPSLSAAFSPDGSALLLGGTRGGLSVWDAHRGLPLFELDRFPQAVSEVLWGPKGWAAAFAADGPARVYSLGRLPSPTSELPNRDACGLGARVYGGAPPAARFLYCENAWGEITVKGIWNRTGQKVE